MIGRRVLLPAAVTAAALGGAVTTVAVRGAPASPPPPAPPVSTARVVRTSLASTMLTAGTLGYAPTRPLINQLNGTYTWLPAPGSRVAPGQSLYKVDNLPVIAMRGGIPAWRPFTPGMTEGPDVRQLQAGLIALGFAAGLLSAPTGGYDGATEVAVERWQAAVGYPVTGQIGLGQVVFLPGPVRVGAASAAPGSPATAGQQPYAVTTERRVVSVPLTPDLPPVHAGEAVSIDLPSGPPVPGRITALNTAPAATGTGGTGAGDTGPAGSAGPGGAAAGALTVRPADPAATGTGTGVAVQVSLPTQSVRDVLAVPVTALLALAGGGYGVEIVTRSGGHHLTSVRAGLFSGGQVAVTGPGISPGVRVVVAQ